MILRKHEKKVISKVTKLISSFHQQSTSTELAALGYYAGHLNTPLMTVAH